MFQLIYTILRQHNIPDEISAKIIYEYDTVRHPCAFMIENHFEEKDYLNYLLESGELIQCDNCGHIWDGNAQCNCYQSWCESYGSSAY